jgi:PadR family transcriptional regulator PadR
MDMARSVDLLQGTLDLLILKTLSWGPAHGYAIARWIEQLTGEARWELSDTKRRAKVYRLTVEGRAQLRAESGTWKQFVQAVGRVLDATEQPA